MVIRLDKKLTFLSDNDSIHAIVPIVATKFAISKNNKIFGEINEAQIIGIYYGDDYSSDNLIVLNDKKFNDLWNEHKSNLTDYSLSQTKYNKENNIETTNETTPDSIQEDEEYTIKEIIIIAILLLVIVFVGDKTIKNKAKKKLKTYIK